jgi:UDP-N-acetylmuramyl pentapeptide phosphotransferase/UDP-N-acetylglucosamine-1-phosphate transferase
MRFFVIAVIDLLLLSSCGLLFAFLQVYFPAVPNAKPVMEELIAFLPWNLEADKVFAGDNGLVALTAVDS